ncbi:MAG: transposase [Methylotenera sp.]|nr:MAG: transposase [Methylotenera sp.]
MDLIYFNNVISIYAPQIELQGLYRVVAVSSDSTTLAKVESGDFKVSSLRKVSIKTLELLEEQDLIHAVELISTEKSKSSSQLNQNEKNIFDFRRKVMEPFFDSKLLEDLLLKGITIGRTVEDLAHKNDCSKKAIYNWFGQLCLHGFTESSLNPNFRNCGAPGKPRHWNPALELVGRKSNELRVNGTEANPQIGVTEFAYNRVLELYKLIKSPKKTDEDVYHEIIEILYVSKYEKKDNELVPVLPKEGTFLNRRQFKHLVDSVNKIEKLKLSTTTGHFERNKRGLSGKAWQHVAGPGHLYAIDSTIADLYLRSSINRAWVVGRPIVYLVVDFWSTAIVGFYVCWTGPCWDMAKVAIFCSCVDKDFIADQWGFTNQLYLDPMPTLPHEILSDRGEYLSKAASQTAINTMFSLSYNPSRRPDLKGLVEVLNRIMKDQQYAFVPGAIDARRKEMELRKYDPDSSVLTLNEYVKYLTIIFNTYNHNADRRNRLDVDMIADSVIPTPAGLWSWGHKVGLGYRKHTPISTMIKELLPTAPASVNRDGVYFTNQPYQSQLSLTQEWSANARNFGSSRIKVHYFPGTMSRIWWEGGASGLTEFTLAQTATTKPFISTDEYLDALMVEKLRSKNLEFQKTFNKLMRHFQTSKIISEAKAETERADLKRQQEVKPSIRETRKREANINQQLNDENVKSNQFHSNQQATENDLYENLINQVMLDSLEYDNEN